MALVGWGSGGGMCYLDVGMRDLCDTVYVCARWL